MALKDSISFGFSLPHRSPDPIDVAAVRQVAQRADALGFRELWVTENTLDHVTCFDPVVLLTRIGGIEVRTAGRALGTTHQGGTVSAENVDSHRVVRGRLSAPGVVEVLQ